LRLSISAIVSLFLCERCASEERGEEAGDSKVALAHERRRRGRKGNDGKDYSNETEGERRRRVSQRGAGRRERRLLQRGAERVRGF